MYYEIIIFVIVIVLFTIFIRKKEKFQDTCLSKPRTDPETSNSTPFTAVANKDGKPAWALDVEYQDQGRRRLHDKYRYTLPTKLQYSIPHVYGTGSPLRPKMGSLNPNSNIIKEKKGWKWYKDGIFNEQHNIPVGSGRLNFINGIWGHSTEVINPRRKDSA